MQVGPVLWRYFHVLRHDGMDYGQYLDQITYLPFLKMWNATADTGSPWGRGRLQAASQAKPWHPFTLSEPHEAHFEIDRLNWRMVVEEKAKQDHLEPERLARQGVHSAGQEIDSLIARLEAAHGPS